MTCKICGSAGKILVRYETEFREAWEPCPACGVRPSVNSVLLRGNGWVVTTPDPHATARIAAALSEPDGAVYLAFVAGGGPFRIELVEKTDEGK